MRGAIGYKHGMLRVRKEAAKLVRMSLPIIATQLGIMLMQLVDIYMARHLGTEAVKAVIVGGTWGFSTLILGMGCVMGIDPEVTQAHGANDGKRAALALQRGILMAIFMSIPVGFLWWFTEPALLLCQQEASVARDAGIYCRVQIFSIPIFLVFIALRHYLQARGVLSAPLIAILFANLLNLPLNQVCIYGGLGIEPMGLVGAGIATGLAKFCAMLGLLAMIRFARLHEGAWVPWSREAYELNGMLTVLRPGLFVALHLAFEVWAFSASTFMAGKLGGANVAAHGVVIKYASLAFMIPLGIAFATAARVGNLIGAKDGRGAGAAAWCGLGLSVIVMACTAALFLAFRNELPMIILAQNDALDPGSTVSEVIALAAGIIPLAAAFQLFDGLQVVAAGILRGIGTVRPAAVINFIGYYGVAIPAALWLTFDWGLGIGLHGIWYGLCAGLASVALLFLYWILRYGPHHWHMERGAVPAAAVVRVTAPEAEAAPPR